MKYKTFGRFLLALAVLSATAGVLWAAPIQVLVNGKPIQTEVPPMVLSGTTYLPLRATAEALGVKLEWQADTKTATLCGKSTCYPIHTSDPASGAKMVKGHLLLPLRKAAEALGAKVTWNEQAKRVEITQ